MAHIIKRDVRMIFEGLHAVFIKAGTPAYRIRSGTSGGFAVQPQHVETTSKTGRGTLWSHDTTYHHIYVPPGMVEEPA